MPNALALSNSPYLQQHAENPVAWLEWGEAAFARARAEDKPIFLSVGYSTCHWCHVMAEESFEDEELAARLNADFVAIKLDREERPDVDRIYMAFVQALTGRGGWPLSVWLTPELVPFFGGTYFPPADRGERKGLGTVLGEIARRWREERLELVAQGEEIVGRLRAYHAAGGGAGGDGADGDVGAPGADEDLTEAAGDAFEGAYAYLFENYDAQGGGFGGAPKFPRASNLAFLGRCAAIQGAESETGREAIDMVAFTLAQMARGGIHDQVGGGFHRYAVDEFWRVPHFEKMLCDQAQLAVSYVEGFNLTGHEAMAWTARGIVDYVLRDLRHEAGGFFSAEDADSAADRDGKKSEGAFYVWTLAEVEEAGGELAGLVADHFGVTAEGNVPAQADAQGELRGRNVLAAVRALGATAPRHGLRAEEAAERLAEGLRRLGEARAGRVRPARDEKVVTAWNGLMLSALARAATCEAAPLVERRAEYRAAAVAAAEFGERELAIEGGARLRRTWRDGRGGGEGLAEDYAFWIAGLLDLYEATFEARWLVWAERLQRTMDAEFGDAAGGGFYSSRAGDTSILWRMKDDYDGAEPAANSVAANNQARLGAMLGDEAMRTGARRTVAALRGRWERMPQSLPAMLVALERVISPARRVVLGGTPETAEFEALAAVARRARGGPWVVVAEALPGAAARARVTRDGVGEEEVATAAELAVVLGVEDAP